MTPHPSRGRSDVARAAVVGDRDDRLRLERPARVRPAATNAHVFTSPLTAEEALDRVEAWLAQPCAAVLQPTKRHAAVLRDLLAPLGTAGNLTSDAHLAALAVEHGAQVCSSDGDLARFPGVELVNPLRG